MAAWTAANAALSQQVSAALAIGGCGCCERNVDTPYHHDNHNPPYDGYDYCQGCYDWGCGDPSDTCSFPSPGGPVSTNPIVNPITPAMLRESWTDDHPSLTRSDKAVLGSLNNAQVQEALDEAMLRHGGVWANMLDEVCVSTTANLLASVPTADSAPEGTLDECQNCNLPISRKGGAWIDDIMGSVSCMSNGDNGVHNPRGVLAAYLKALQKGSPDKKKSLNGGDLNGTPGDMPMLYVVTSEGSNREDGNVYYSTYLLFNEPTSRRAAIDNALVGLLGGKITSTGVSFETGRSPAADDLWEDKDALTSELSTLGFDVYQAYTVYLEGQE